MAYAVTQIGPSASHVVSLNNAGQLAYQVPLDLPKVTLVYQNGALAELQSPPFFHVPCRNCRQRPGRRDIHPPRAQCRIGWVPLERGLGACANLLPREPDAG